MILLNDIEKFHSMIMELKESQIQFKLYGNMEEAFSGAFAGFEQPPNNTLRIKIVALTGIGTMYCNSSIRLNNTDAINLARRLYSDLPISETQISYDKDSGIITIS